MRTFAIGALVAVLLTGGAAYLYRLGGVSSAEHSSPAPSVRLDGVSSNGAKEGGYGSFRRQAGDNGQMQETARR